MKHTDQDGNHLDAKQTEDEDEAAKSNKNQNCNGPEDKNETQNMNQRLMTPKIRRIINQKDAVCMLKEEIGESLLRLKAAKFGHAIEDIVPQHSNAFYLP